MQWLLALYLHKPSSDFIVAFDQVLDKKSDPHRFGLEVDFPLGEIGNLAYVLGAFISRDLPPFW